MMKTNLHSKFSIYSACEIYAFTLAGLFKIE